MRHFFAALPNCIHWKGLLLRPNGRGNFPTPAILFAIGLLSLALGCDRSQPGADPLAFVSTETSPAIPHQLELARRPSGSPSILTGALDDKGNPVSIACAVCHATKPANQEARLGTSLAQFHQGLIGAHGNLSCLSCHNPADGFSSLRLADGRRLPYSEAMALCAQCHGPQYRDYQHGAHGGMIGYWDLKKGGRVRNQCVDCHDPHAPKYPVVTPARGPNDRFLKGGGHE